MKTAIVLGGAGYVGSVLSNYLLNTGLKVTIFDTFEYGVESCIGLLKAGVELVKGDIRNIKQLAQAVQGKDCVFHLAGLVGFPLCEKESERSFSTTVTGTHNLLGCLTKSQLLVYASTGSVYGKLHEICKEESPCNPQSTYGKHKLQAESMILDAGGVALRFATLFGASPCMRFNLLPNDFVWRAIKHGYIVLYRGDDRRTFLSVDDACRAYLSCIVHENTVRGQVYNVGDEALNLKKRDLAIKIKEQFAYDIFEQPSGIDPDFRDYEVCYEKFRKATGFAPASKLETEICELGRLIKVTDLKVPWRFEV